MDVPHPTRTSMGGQHFFHAKMEGTKCSNGLVSTTEEGNKDNMHMKNSR